MISGTQTNLWTTANTFFYADKTGWELLENSIIKALSNNPLHMADSLSGKVKMLYMPGHMYTGTDDYNLILNNDPDNVTKASLVAQKINEALATGKILIVQIYHNLSGPVGGWDWFSATFGVVSETMQEVKAKFKAYDMTKDELKVKIDKIWFKLEDAESDGVR